MTSTRVLAVALVVGSAFVADARGAGFPSSFHAGAKVDVNMQGQAIVAWSGSNGVRAVVGDRAGGFSPAAVLSTARDTLSSPQAAIDERGDAIVVWETYRQSGGGQCSTCGPLLVPSGVWASLRRSASGFGTAVALAGPQRDTGAEYQLAEPHLAMSSTGEAVVAWSDAGGAMAAFRSPGAEIQAPQRVQPPGFVVHSVAVSGGGDTFLADGTGRVTVRPSGATSGVPVLLPESASPYGRARVRCWRRTPAVMCSRRTRAAAVSSSAGDRPGAAGASRRHSAPLGVPARARWRCLTVAWARSASCRAAVTRGSVAASACSWRPSAQARRRHRAGQRPRL